MQLFRLSFLFILLIFKLHLNVPTSLDNIYQSNSASTFCVGRVLARSSSECRLVAHPTLLAIAVQQIGYAGRHCSNVWRNGALLLPTQGVRSSRAGEIVVVLFWQFPIYTVLILAKRVLSCFSLSLPKYEQKMIIRKLQSRFDYGMSTRSSVFVNFNVD